MSSTVTIPAVRPYSSITTASELRWRWRSASRSSSGLVSGTIGASRTRSSIRASGPSVSSFWASALACTMPLTRSWFSSSVTTSRVWPDETQRRSAVSTFSDRSTVTIAGAGVITWRACCSCRWKTPVSMLRLTEVELAAGQRLRDQDLELLGRAALVELVGLLDPDRAQDRVRRAVQHVDERVEDRVKTCSGRAIRRATRFGAVDRVDLRHLLADRDVQRRRDQVGEEERDRRSETQLCASVPIMFSKIDATAGSPRKPMPSEVNVMPSWHDGEVLRQVVELAQQRAPAPRMPSSAISSMRERRMRTSANSAATKKPLSRTSANDRQQEQDGHRRIRGPRAQRGATSGAVVVVHQATGQW